jgi:hypothetical protein
VPNLLIVEFRRFFLEPFFKSGLHERNSLAIATIAQGQIQPLPAESPLTAGFINGNHSPAALGDGDAEGALFCP